MEVVLTFINFQRGLFLNSSLLTTATLQRYSWSLDRWEEERRYFALLQQKDVNCNLK